jgi:WD40 repeat protein
MIWTQNKLQMALYGYKLLWTVPGANQKAVYGGSSMSIQGLVSGSNNHQQMLDGITTVMVGPEGGKIFRCQMELNDAAVKDFAAKAAAATNDKGVDLKSPIKDGGYSSHAGAVLSLHCSPFVKELFLTSGYDGSVRLYSSLKKQHLLEVAPSEKPLWTIKWSPFRPFVFATAGSDGRVFFYDLLRVKKGLVAPTLVIEASPDGLPVHSLAFSSTDPTVFATGGSLGTQIWKLPESLGSVQKGEEGLLRKVANADDMEETLRTAN